MADFWHKLKKGKGEKPIICLAPMADVTDRAFRRIIAKYGSPDVMWTEFVSADGLFLGGYDALINDLSFTEKERPIVAQFFTSRPDMMGKASALARKLGFDGIDINMGCPDKSVEKQKAGAKLITNSELAKEIILSAKKSAGRLPVSVKTRIGWSKNELETWLPALLETKPSVITVHARTRKELSLVPAKWEYVKRAVEIRNEMKSDTLIFGNGDVLDLEDAKQKAKETGCDGIMIGRAVFGNPWIFNPNKKKINVKEKLKVLVEHTKLFEKLVQPKPLGDRSYSEGGQARPHQCHGGQVRPRQGFGGQGKSFAVMKKHFKAYVSGWDGAKELRIKLMETQNSKEVEKVIKKYLKNGLK